MSKFLQLEVEDRTRDTNTGCVSRFLPRYVQSRAWKKNGAHAAPLGWPALNITEHGDINCVHLARGVCIRGMKLLHWVRATKPSGARPPDPRRYDSITDLF